jgi:hypothetical protein
LNQQSHSESEVKEDDDHETEAANFPEGADDTRESSRRKKKKKRRRKPEIKSWNSHRSSEDNLEVFYFCFLHAIAVRHTQNTLLTLSAAINLKLEVNFYIS